MRTLPEPHPSRCPRWAWLALLAILVGDVWLRGHTFGPSLRARFGLDLWPVTGAEAEPLDCDESAYAYIGRRLVRGDVLYRDLTENKPPGGYWLYALAVALGGAEELTIRVMPIPFVLATIALVWWLGLRLRGPGAACLAALIYAVASTDPYLFGNGANMEHFLNAFAVASLAALVWAWERPGAIMLSGRSLGGRGQPAERAPAPDASARHQGWRPLRGLAPATRSGSNPIPLPHPERPGRWGLFVAGVLLGAACLVKQVAVLDWPVYVGALLLRRGVFASRLKDILALTAGAALIGVVAVAVILAQGAGHAAFEDVIQYGGALAADTPPEPHAPPRWVRWITGNADPRDGRLPWPFGRTDYLVWWGTGTWPLWLAAVPAVGWLAFGSGATGPRRIAAAWTLSAWVQVALPGLFWQHYYLLPVPGIALAVAVFLAESLGRARRGAWALVAAVLVLALGGTAFFQWRDYLRVAPVELTVRYKGGRQWSELTRPLGRELARRATVWPRPHLYIWGWQSPLLIYSRLDSPTRHFFVDELLKTVAGGNHPPIRPRTRRLLEARAAEVMNDLRARPPELIFVGHPPFPALSRFLNEGYLPSHLVRMSPVGQGLWVRRDRYGEFETFAR